MSFIQKAIFMFSIRPILFGLFAMMISGISFPLAGVIVLRNGLIPIRFMLMHGVLLSGIIAVAFNLPLLPISIIINIFLVLMIIILKKKLSNFIISSSAIMVLTMAMASLLSHILNVPAKDTLNLLWGSPFALSLSDLIILIMIALILILYCVSQYEKIKAIFFDLDVALSIGINTNLHQSIMIFLSSLIIAVSMKIMGALLLDALLILPVLSIKNTSSSVKILFIKSSIYGFIISLIGYIIAVMGDFPVSGVISIIAVIIYFASSFLSKYYIQKRHMQ